MLTAAIFLRKTVIPADILQKNPGIFFVLMRKRLTQSGKQISAEEEQKTLECFFCSKTEAIIYPHLRITKVSENSDKIQFGRNQANTRFNHFQLYLCE